MNVEEEKKPVTHSKIMDTIFSDISRYNSRSISEASLPAIIRNQPLDDSSNVQSIKSKKENSDIEIEDDERTRQLNVVHEENIGDFINLFEKDTIINRWKPVNRTVWNARENDPNLFFYYFHKFDEELTISPFEQIEEENLLHILLQIYSSSISMDVALKRVQGKWGFLSLKIPYRNGLMCYQHYLKLRTKRNEFKSDVVFLEFLKEKVTEEDLIERATEKNFLKFFMNLSPGYQERDQYSDFWMKEALKNLSSEDALAKIEKVEQVLRNVTEKKHFLITSREEWKNMPGEAFASISKHPYVSVQKNLVPKLSPTAHLIKESPMKSPGKSTGTTKNSSKEASVKKSAKKFKEDEENGMKENGLLKALAAGSDRVNRSTDVSTIVGEKQSSQVERSENKANFTYLLKSHEELPGLKVVKKKAVKKKEEKKEKKVRKMTEDQKKRINELLATYKVKVENYDSEPERKLPEGENKNLPMFFSEISSIKSQEELEETESGLGNLSIFRDLRLGGNNTDETSQTQWKKGKKNEVREEKRVETGKRRFKDLEASGQQNQGKKKVKLGEMNFFDQEPLLGSGKKNKRKSVKRNNFNQKKRESRKIRLEKEMRGSPSKLIVKAIPKKRVKKEKEARKVFYEDEMELPNVQQDLSMTKFRDVSDIDKENKRAGSPKKQTKLNFVKTIKRILTREETIEEIRSIQGKVGLLEEKRTTFVNYSVLNEFIEDEDVMLQNFYSRLIRFNETLKKFSNIMNVFSLVLYEDFDPEILLLIKKEWEVLSELEKEFYKITLFSTVKDNLLKESGELGQKCLKLLAAVDLVIYNLLQKEGLGLRFILGLAHSDKKPSEELAMKEHLDVLLKFHRNFAPFLRKFSIYFVKSTKAYQDFITENAAYYFLTDAYLNDCSQAFNLSAHEEFIATLLAGTDNGGVLWTQIVQGLNDKVKAFVQYLIKVFHDKDPFAMFIDDSLGAWDNVIKIYLEDHLMNIFKRNNEKIEVKESYTYACFAVLWLKYALNLQVPFSSIAQNLSSLSETISSKPLECYIMTNIKFIFSMTKVTQYFSPIATIKSDFIEKTENLLIETLEVSKTENQIIKGIEIIIQASQICSMKTSFFFDVYGRLTKLLKGNNNIQFNDFSPIKVLNNEKITLNSFMQLTTEMKTLSKSQKLCHKNQANIFLCPLLLYLLYSQELESEVEETKKIKLTKRTISKCLSAVQNYSKLNEESIQDSKLFRLFLMDFGVIIAIISLTRKSPDLLRSIHLKLNNFVGNLNDSHMIIRSLMLNLQIELMNFCIPFHACHTLVGEVHEKVFSILSGLLNEFLEVSKYMNMLSRFNKYEGKELDESEEKYLRLQKLIEDNMLKLRIVANTHFNFIIENKIQLFPKGNSAFLSMLNPKNPITAGLRKQVLEYLELAVPSTDKLNQTLKTREFTAPSSPMEQEDDIEFMTKMLERAKTHDSLTVDLINWRQNVLNQGKEIIATIQEMIMSIYNKEILTKVHSRFHIDIFLVERGLDLYAIFAKLLLLNGQLTHEYIEQQFGLNSLFSSSKLSRMAFFNMEIVTKGILLSRNQKLALLLRFYTTFLAFEKDQNKALLTSNNKTTQGIENFLTSAHVVLFLASIQTVSNLSIIQQGFYDAMSDFAVLLYSQDKDFTEPGLKEFLMASYIERGFTNDDPGRDTIGYLKKIIYNLEMFCMENEADEKRLLLKFLEKFSITLIRHLRQDLFDECHSNNNGKYFLNVYKNLCGLITALSKVFSSASFNRSLTDILSFIFMDTFNKISFNPVDDFLSFYDPFMIKAILNENLCFETKPLINAVFSIPHKDKHFPRKVFVKLLIFLLKTDFAKLEKVVSEQSKTTKVKKWEVAFKKDNEFSMVSEIFLQNLFSFCQSSNHTETLLNTLREIVNYTMLQDGEKGLVIPFLKALHSTLSNQNLGILTEKLLDIMFKLSDLIGVTEYSFEEKISLLYFYRLIINQRSAIQIQDEYYSNIYKVSVKWIIEVLLKFDSSLIEKLRAEGIEVISNISNLSQAGNRGENEINEMEVKLFAVAIKICDQCEHIANAGKNLAMTLKELIQEKIKIKLSLGDAKFSGEVKKILQILNEF